MTRLFFLLPNAESLLLWKLNRDPCAGAGRRLDFKPAAAQAVQPIPNIFYPDMGGVLPVQNPRIKAAAVVSHANLIPIVQLPGPDGDCAYAAL